MNSRAARLLATWALLLVGCVEVGEPDLASVTPGIPESRRPGADGREPDSGASAEPPGLDDGTSACRPEAGGPHSIEEGEALVAEVRCGTGLPLDGAAFTLTNLPAGASYDAASGQLRWTPRLDQAGIHVVTIAARELGEQGRARIAVADRFDHPFNVPIASEARYTDEMGLPVLHLQVAPDVGEAYVPAKVWYGGHLYGIEAKRRGRSSLDYPKNSFTLKFDKGDKFNDASRGFAGKRRIVLVSTFDDNSYVRQRLSYEVWNRVSAGKIEIRSFSAVVYLNGQYQGLYTVADNIDGNLVEDHGLPESGNLYKGIDHEANFAVLPYPDIWEKKEGPSLDVDPAAYDDLIELVSFVAESDAETFRAQVGSRIDLRDYWAWLITTTAIAATDSLGKNAYHYHDPRSGIWRVVPWDFNASFGQAWNTAREPVGLDAIELGRGWNRLFQRLLDDPVLGPRTRDRYAEALENDLRVDRVLALLDALTAEVAPSARRDERRWRADYLRYERWADRRDFTDFEGEVAYVRSWISRRWPFLVARL